MQAFHQMLFDWLFIVPSHLSVLNPNELPCGRAGLGPPSLKFAIDREPRHGPQARIVILIQHDGVALPEPLQTAPGSGRPLTNSLSCSTVRLSRSVGLSVPHANEFPFIKRKARRSIRNSRSDW